MYSKQGFYHTIATVELSSNDGRLEICLHSVEQKQPGVRKKLALLKTTKLISPDILFKHGCRDLSDHTDRSGETRLFARSMGKSVIVCSCQIRPIEIPDTAVTLEKVVAHIRAQRS